MRYAAARCERITMDALVFQLDDRRCALQLSDVHEIILAMASTPLPGAPDVVTGVINVRGELAALLDIRPRFGLAPRPPQSTDHFILSRSGGRLVAICVDRAVELISIPSHDIEAAQELAESARYISGIARVPDGLILICDLGKFLSRAETDALKAALARVPTPAS